MRHQKQKKAKFVQVIVRSLGRYGSKKRRKGKCVKVLGLYFKDGNTSNTIGKDTILIEPKQNQRGFLTSLIHEMLHRECFAWTETKVETTACRISRVIWDQGYRKEQ